MNRWKWIAAALVMPLVAVTVMAAGPQHGRYRADAEIIDNTTFFDANSLLMFVTNTGSIAYDKTAFLGKSDGLYFPKGTNQTVIFAGGIWMGCKVNGEIRGFVSEYSNECVPGPMANGTFQSDRGRFQVYKIAKGDTPDNNPDYRDWPFQDGAPHVVDENGDPVLDGEGNMIPLRQGDQALWCVYNDADPSAHANDAMATEPMGVEVHQYVFGYARKGALGQTIFVRYQIINKGENNLKDAYISLWADPDLGDAGDDFVGCDTALSLGFCYNDGEDDTYGSNPPAVGYDFFQGPVVPGNANDSAWVSSKGVYLKGYKNLPMTSFNKYINGTDPHSKGQTYNYMQGLTAEGAPQADPNTDEVTKYVVAGDPVTNTGWLDDASDDRRYMMSTGPFDMAPGDTQEVVAAVLVGRGADRLSSITELRKVDKIAQQVFDLNFNIPGPPPQPSIWAVPHDRAVQLFWGLEANDDVQYLIGPSTDPEVRTEDTLQTFVMEGLNLYQGLSSSGPWTKIASYDVVDGVERIYSELDGDDGIERVVVQRGTESGLSHELWVSDDKLRGGALVNNRPYYYTITAYNYDEQNARPYLITEGGEESYGIITEAFENLPGAAQVQATPRSMTGVLADTANHVAGPGDGSVLIDFYDQNMVTGDSYEVTFYDSCVTEDDGEGHLVTSCQTLWNLTNATNGVGMLSFQQQGLGSQGVDGMILRVLGPPPGVRDWDIPSGTRRFTWAGGANGWEFEGFEGAIGWVTPHQFFGGASDPGVPAPFIKNVVLKLADVDVDGNFDPNDANVSYGYRFGRNFTAEPAKPEFAQYIINAVGGYSFQDFNRSVPMSAWDVEANPPRRLAIAYMENNVEGGLVDGKYWPPFFDDADNTAGTGPREWLFIYDADYSQSFDANLAQELIDNNPPIMYWCTFARRAAVAWETGDEFAILANHVNSPLDIFRFTTAPPGSAEGTVVKETVENVAPVPNPYYNLTKLERDQFQRQLKFINLPAARTTIRIFNLAGDLIRTLVKDDPGTAEIGWDVLTETGIPVASGLYIYHVEAEGLGSKVGKVAVFTEVEQLEQF